MKTLPQRPFPLAPADITPGAKETNLSVQKARDYTTAARIFLRQPWTSRGSPLTAPRRDPQPLIALALLALLAGIPSCAPGGEEEPSTISSNGQPSPAPPPPPPAASPVTLSLAQFATGLHGPVGASNAGRGDPRLFVIEQAGIVRIVESNGTVSPTPFLDISTRVRSTGNEQGLLGLAFHPSYAANARFYVNYTGNSGHTHISQFSVTGNPDAADPNSEDILLTVNQPSDNHNAGDMHFGPDGLLYVPLGDGGGSGDPGNNAQNVGTLLGKVVRIDVDSGGGTGPDCQGQGSGHYTIPSSNPFVDGAGGTCDEIWATGLRNPWRSSFDRLTGDFFIADVGQNQWEEINFQPAGSQGGQNYGWRCYEGTHPFNTAGCRPMNSFTFPILEYQHGGGDCSVTGGYVYRGTAFPLLFGRYVLTDFCTGNFWDILPDGAGGWQITQHTNLRTFGYVSFGEDSAGELYVIHRGNGTLSRLQSN